MSRSHVPMSPHQPQWCGSSKPVAVREPGLWTKRALYEQKWTSERKGVGHKRTHATLHANFIRASPLSFSFWGDFSTGKGWGDVKVEFRFLWGQWKWSKSGRRRVMLQWRIPNGQAMNFIGLYLLSELFAWLSGNSNQVTLAVLVSNLLYRH